MAGENSKRVVEVVCVLFLMVGENSKRVLAGELGGELAGELGVEIRGVFLFRK